MAARQTSVVRRIEKQVDAGLGAASRAVAGAVDSVEGAMQGLVAESRQTRYLAYLFRRAQEDQIAQVAGSLTYTTLLSLVPFVTIALGLFTAFPIFDQLRDALEEFLIESFLPEEASNVVLTHVTEFSSKAAGLTAAGVFALGVTAVLLMQTIDRAFNAIWRVPRPRALAQRILVYWAAVSLGPLLIGSGLVITSYLVSASLGWLPGGAIVTHAVLALLPVAMTATAFTLLYVAVPNRDVQWKHAAIGGIAAALGFELMKNLFGAYIARFPTYHLIYGAFAAIPIFLLWIYLSWVVTLLGGLIAATWPLLSYERAETRRWPGSAFADAMRVLALLDRHRAQGGATPRQIRAELRAGFSDSETLLEDLRGAGWVARAQGAGGETRWVLIADLGTVKVADVFTRFAFDPALARRRLDAGDSALDHGVARVAALIESGLGVTLAEAFDQPAAPAAPLTKVS